jgi:hypothetical protein
VSESDFTEGTEHFGAELRTPWAVSDLSDAKGSISFPRTTTAGDTNGTRRGHAE